MLGFGRKISHLMNSCIDRGIYGAICLQPKCGKVYIGQASVSYSKRWNGHRFEWKAVGHRCAAARREFTVIALFAPMPFA